MAEARYQSLRKLVKGEERVLDNGNSIVTGTIGNYPVELELRNLRPSGQQLTLKLDGSNRYGRRVLRHCELLDLSNNEVSDKIQTEGIENRDPEFQGKSTYFFNYTKEKTLKDFLVFPTILVSAAYLYGTTIQGLDFLTTVGIVGTGTFLYYLKEMHSLIREKGRSISRVKVYSELKKLLGIGLKKIQE